MYWSIARIDLAVSEADFWRLTPHKLGALLKRLKAHERREEALLALLRHDVINFSFCRPKEPLTMKDLLPEEDAGTAVRRASGKPRRLTAKLREEIANSWRVCLMGEMEAPRKG